MPFEFCVQCQAITVPEIPAQVCMHMLIKEGAKLAIHVHVAALAAYACRHFERNLSCNWIKSRTHTCFGH